MAYHYHVFIIVRLLLQLHLLLSNPLINRCGLSKQNQTKSNTIIHVRRKPNSVKLNSVF